MEREETKTCHSKECSLGLGHVIHDTKSVRVVATEIEAELHGCNVKETVCGKVNKAAISLRYPPWNVEYGYLALCSCFPLCNKFVRVSSLRDISGRKSLAVTSATLETLCSEEKSEHISASVSNRRSN